MLFSCLVYLTLGFFVEKLLNKTKQKTLESVPMMVLFWNHARLKPQPTDPRLGGISGGWGGIGCPNVEGFHSNPWRLSNHWDPWFEHIHLIWKYSLSKKNRRENINSIPCHHHAWLWHLHVAEEIPWDFWDPRPLLEQNFPTTAPAFNEIRFQLTEKQKHDCPWSHGFSTKFSR